MTLLKTSIAFFIALYFSSSCLAQNMFSDAIAIQKYCNAYDANPALFDALVTNDSLLSELVIGLQTTLPSGNDDYFGTSSQHQTDLSIGSGGILKTKTVEILSEAVREEMAWLNDFAQMANNNNYDIFSSEIDFKDLKHLNAVIAFLENVGIGEFTSGLSIGSFIGVSEAEIIKGVADWSLNRAQEELMQSFLQKWQREITEDATLSQLFPHTITMMNSSELISIFNDGATWKSTFQEDLNQVPQVIPSVYESLRNTYFSSGIPNETHMEILSGLQLVTSLYNEVGKGKSPADILAVLGENVMSELGTDDASYIQKTILTAEIFTTSLRDENAFIEPQEIYAASSDELKTFWTLIALKNVQKFSKVFQSDFSQYHYAIIANIDKFKQSAARIADDFNAISKAVSNSNGTAALTLEKFKSYSTVVFDVVDHSLESLISFNKVAGDDPVVLKLETFKSTYFDLLTDAKNIQESVITKEYGRVIVNAVNLFSSISEKASVELSDKQKAKFDAFLSAFNKYGKVMTSIIMAENSEDIENALENAAMPVGGYMVKQQSSFSASVTFLPGVKYGTETVSALNQLSTTSEAEGSFMAATLPLGIEVTKGVNKKGLGKVIGAFGVNAQFFDLGAVLNYSLQGSNDSIIQQSTFGFKDVWSLGASGMIHFRNTPIALGYGFSTSPNLRMLTNESGAQIKAKTFQHGIILAVDLNVIPLFTSRKKYAFN